VPPIARHEFRTELGYTDTNPARGRKRRLKAAKPRRTWLEVDELRALLDA
jgi:hypothetical protein